MPAAKLTDEERKTLADLNARQKEEEREIEEAQKSEKEAREREQKAQASGNRSAEERAEKDQEIARVSESTAHALLEQTRALMGLLEERLRESGVPQEKIEEAKRAGIRRRPGRTS